MAGQPVALVVAETEAAAEDGAALVVVDAEPLPAVLDLEAAMAPGAPRARTAGRTRGGGDVGGAHAAVGGGDDDAPEEDLSDNVDGRQRLPNGDAAAGARVAPTRRCRGAASDALGPPGLPRAAVGDGVARLRRHARRAERARRARSSPARASRELLDLPLDRVRVRPTPLGGAFGGKLMLPEPLAAAAALTLKRPVRRRVHAHGGLRRGEPRAGRADRRRGSAPRATASSRRSARRIVCDRGDERGVRRRVDLVAAHRRPVPLARARAAAATAWPTNRVGSGAYRGAGAPPAAFAVETLLDELAAALDIDPIELRLRNVFVEGDAGIDGQPFPPFGAAECLERVRDHALWRGRAELPAGEGVGRRARLLAGRARAGGGDLPPRRRRQADVITGAVDMSGIENAFGSIAAEAFGIADGRRARRRRRHVEHAVRAALSGGSKVTYTVGRAVSAPPTRRASGCCRSRRPSSRSRPRTSRSSTARCARSARRAAGWRSPTWRRRCCTFGSPYEPIEGYAGVAQTSRAPAAAAHLVARARRPARPAP